MCKKLVFMCLALMLASTAYAADPFLMGSWESASDGYYDWGANLPISDSTLMPSKYAYDDSVWSTAGDWCLKLTKAGWNQNLTIRSYQSSYSGYVAGFLAHDSLTIDLHFEAGDYVAGDWAEIYELAIQGTGVGWASYAKGATNQTDVMNPTNQGHWDQTTGTYTTTVSWNYSAQRDTMIAAGLTPSSGYVSFIFATNTNTANGSTGIFRLDNFRFTGVPEPATMALLGLGGLALLRRKR